MIRLTKLSDYAIVLLTYFSSGEDGNVSFTARELGDASGLSLPTVSKILKALSKNGLLTSHRGVKGGYTLARSAAQIAITDIITAIDGPIALTQCSDGEKTECEIAIDCPVRSNWKTINDKVLHALSDLSLADMAGPLSRQFVHHRKDKSRSKLTQIGSR